MNNSIWEAETGGSASSGPAWATRARSRTGSKATEKPGVEKPKKKSDTSDTEYLKYPQMGKRTLVNIHGFAKVNYIGIETIIILTR